MNIHLELAKMVCMGWRPVSEEKIQDLLKRYKEGTPSLNEAERALMENADDLLALRIGMQKANLLSQNIVQPNNVSETVKKRRGCPPGGWPKKDKPPEHD